MKKLIILFFLVTVFLHAQDLSFWQDIRNSSVTEDNEIFIHCEMPTEILNYTSVSTVEYSCENNWQTANLDFLWLDDFGIPTWQTTIEADIFQTQTYYFKTEQDSAVILMPKFCNPPQNLADYSLVTTDPIGDCEILNKPNLDIISEHFAYSDDRFYAVIQNNGDEFPTDNGGFFPDEYYIYGAGFVNIETALIDTTVYAMIYLDVLGFFNPGLYKFSGTDIEDMEQIGEIEYEIDGDLLYLSCNISDLTEDENFGEWPNESNSLGFESVTQMVSLEGMEPSFSFGDMTKPAVLVFDDYKIESFQNVLPEITNISVESDDYYTTVWLEYFDANGHFPLVHEIIVQPGNITFPMIELSHDFSETVEFVTNMPAYWSSFEIVFSDNNSDFVSEFYGNEPELEFSVDSLSILTVADAAEGKPLTIYNNYQTSININSLNFSDGYLDYFPYDLEFPITLNADSLELTIYMPLPVFGNREIIINTFFVETDFNLYSIPIAVDTSIIDSVSVENNELEITNYNLSNHPNPFTLTTTISFNLTPENAHNAKIEIYNMKGQKVKALSNLQINNSAIQQIIWDAKNQASGIYFVQLVVDKKTVASQKMILLK